VKTSPKLQKVNRRINLDRWLAKDLELSDLCESEIRKGRKDRLLVLQIMKS
jgi:hypothetical protein